MKNKLVILLAIFVFMPLSIFAQNISVKGRVFDENMEPLAGAIVTEIGNPSNGAATDVDGHFALKVSSDKSSIKVSFVGYNNYITRVETNRDMKIELSSNTTLEEVVVVGFGKQKQITTVGAISSVSNKELRQSPAASLQNALAGKLPGLFSLQTSGQPGADGASVFIRGVSSFSGASKSPLLLVDDIETDFGSLSRLDPNEIENVTILKDASSTAIYGVKGGNGVILVTTRRGSDKAPRITFRTSYALSKPTIKNNTLGSYESLLLLKELYENTGKNPEAMLPDGYLTPEALEHFRLGDMPYLYPDVDWYDATMKKYATQTRTNVDITGGTQQVKYFLSFGYLNQDGIMKEPDRKEDFNSNYYVRRYNLRSNIDIEPNKNFKISINASADLNEKNSPYNVDTQTTSGAWPLFRRLGSGILPTYAFPVKYENGFYGGLSGAGATTYSGNPLAMLEYSGYDRQFTNNVKGSLTLDHKLDFITKGLGVKATMALTNNWGYERRLRRDNYPEYRYEKGELVSVKPNHILLSPLAVSREGVSPLRKITTQFIMNYKTKIGEHSLNVMGLANWDTQKRGSGDPENFRGISGRIAYDYKMKYILELNAGYNGTDRFKAKNKYGFFPAVSGGWVLSEENFLKGAFETAKIDFLKIRASFGLVGSDAFDGNNRYLYAETYNRPDPNGAANQYYFGEVPSSIANVFPGSLGNDDVRWDMKRSFGAAVELKMFRSRLNITVDYFKEHHYDILTKRATIPSMAGITSPPVNMGIVDNKGWEYEAIWRDKIGEVGYSIRGSISIAKNIIIEKDEAKSQYVNQWTTGRPVGQIFGYIWDGYYTNQAELINLPDRNRTSAAVGDFKYKDVSGPNGIPDGIIDNYDICPIGNPSTPQMTYDFSGTLNYKNFDFSFVFQGAAQGSILASDVLQIGTVGARPRSIHQSRWKTEEGADNSNVGFGRLGGSNFDNSTYWLRPRDYIRLKNVEIGYNLPSNISKKIGMNSVRIYFNGSDLFTWSNLSIYDVDPEAQSGAAAAYSNYPHMSMLNAGLQITF